MSKKHNHQLNNMRLNMKPDLVAYLDAVIEEQTEEITRLNQRQAELESQLTQCRLMIGEINRHLDDNAEYSLTRSKVVRLLKKMDIYDGNE